MKVLIDAMRATHGGIATYTRNLIRAWACEFPDDTLHVLIGPDNDAVTANTSIVWHPVEVPRPGILGRPLVQSRTLPALARRFDVDVLLSTLPTTTLRHPGVPTVVVVHDLRHELRPAQFSRGRRVLRTVSYSRGYSLADAFIAISQRTLDDLQTLHPATRDRPATVVHHGADHICATARTKSRPVAVAFGHHSNKNVDLVLDGWARLSTQLAPDSLPSLLIIGLNDQGRRDAARLLAARGLAGRVELAPFLPEEQFRATIGGARLVVFPSDFEGFGLPALEAMQLGIPVVVGPDPAVLEISGGHANVMGSWDVSGLTAAVRHALDMSEAAIESARAHASMFTWAATARHTRAALSSAQARTTSRPTR